MRETEAAWRAKDQFAKVISELREKSLAGPVTTNLDDFKNGPSHVHMKILERVTKTLHLNLHEDPAEVLAALLTSTSKSPPANGSKIRLRQKVLKADETIVYWSLVEQNKDYQLLLRLRVETQDDQEIRISVESIDEEDLDSTCLPVPQPSATRTFRLRLKGGTIILRPLPFGQTSFTFTAQPDIFEVEQFANPDPVTSSSKQGSPLGGIAAAVRTSFSPKR